jgi:hypothetical protein
MAISSSSRFLGSAGTFEACAKFCYNTISTHNLVLLQCAAAHRGKLGTSSTPLHFLHDATRPRWPTLSSTISSVLAILQYVDRARSAPHCGSHVQEQSHAAHLV